MCSAKLFFVDDLNAVKASELTAANHEIVLDWKRCQHQVHNWGKANQASFDATKESMHILALTSGEGYNFRLLGVPFDHALRMKDAVTEIVGNALWNLGAILRTAPFFNDAEIIQLYTSKLLSCLKYRTAAMHNSCDTILQPLNNFQEHLFGGT